MDLEDELQLGLVEKDLCYAYFNNHSAGSDRLFASGGFGSPMYWLKGPGKAKGNLVVSDWGLFPSNLNGVQFSQKFFHFFSPGSFFPFLGLQISSPK